MKSTNTEAIRRLNDAFRTTMTGGRVLMAAGVDALASDIKAMAIRKVTTFTKFTADTDPHSEHDFGSFEVAGQKFFWKIDYYDPTVEFGSEGPADPEKNHARAHEHVRKRLLIVRSPQHTPPPGPATVPCASECMPRRTKNREQARNLSCLNVRHPTTSEWR